jgi:hypothetical protein
LLMALARAFRWKRMLDDGRHASVSEIAKAEKLDRTYVGDILRLTLLAPEIVEAIVEVRQPVEVALPGLMKAIAADWREQFKSSLVGGAMVPVHNIWQLTTQEG